MAKTIYPGIPFSPITTLTQPINAEDTIIYVENAEVFPDGPNIATIGTDENAETISYAQKGDGFLSGCVRGLEGDAKAWQIDEVIARNFTDYDYQSLIEAIAQNTQTKANKSETVFDAKRAYQNYTTVLEMVNSVSDGGTVIAFGNNQSPLYNAEDRPPTLCEYFYLILSDGLRKNVVAFGFTSPNIYMRRVWDKVWSTDWTQVGIQNINGLLATKADKNKALQTNLYAQYASDLKNPAVTVDDIAIFDNPPLTQMAKLDYHTSNYAVSAANKPKNAPPLASANAYWWEILTFSSSPTRALQIATQCFTGDKNGRMFLRTRHLDNSDYTKWQAWREVATCYCDEMEPKLVPLTDGWITWNTGYDLKYRKAYGNILMLNGLIKPSATNQDLSKGQIGTLPAGYRPALNWYTICPLSGGVGYARIQLDPNGIIALSGYSNKNALLSSLELQMVIDLAH